MVDFNLNAFMSTYGDYARSYLFKCTVNKLNAFGVRDHEYLVKSTRLPESTIDEIESDWQGMKYKIGGTQQFTDFTVSFNMDVGGNIRTAFLKWMGVIHNPETSIHSDPTVYFTDIKLDHLNGQFRKIMTYELIGAWPKSVGEVSLDYAAKEIATFDVTFSYQYHRISEGTSGIASTGTNITATPFNYLV